MASYAATYAVTLVLGGRVGDLYGRQRVFLVGLIGFALASLLCGIAPAPAVLVVGRILQGVTAALMAPQSLALIRAGLTGRQQSIALGFHGAVFGLAAVLGQSLGGLLVAAIAALWARYEVGPRIQEDKHFQHPDIGEIRLHFEKLTIESAPGQHLAVYTAEPGIAAADGLALLTSLAADGAAVDQPGVSEEWCNRP
ncbi:MFS transporter [Pseudonocardia oceani]|uniref:MFS transporter n=1 Tax=Pseudonocardia oceani TaxID=2792013 RepID=UPI001C4A4C7D|nr:MFS transporter [Pseudonocardia oceani]